MSPQSQRPRYIRGTDAAIALLKTIGASDVPLRLTRLSESLGVPRASLYRIIRTLAEHGLLSLVRKGWVAPGPTWAAFAAKFEAICRSEDERSRRGDAHGTEGGSAGYGLLRNPDTSVITRGRFLHAPKFRIGFANAALDNPWRTALVHAVEMGAARRADLVASLSVRHASRSIQRQIDDIEALASQGVEGLIISAVDCGALAPAIAAAASRGIPTVLVDRGDCALNRVASHVACDNWMIGHTMAHWLAERIGGRGGIVMLAGDASAEPARVRREGAHAALEAFPGISILGSHWTDWQRERANQIVRSHLSTSVEKISGVWCDSGLQAAGSITAFIESNRYATIPPHTGGDLNLTYKLAIRHDVALAAVNYPPAMGLRAMDVLIDVLRGRPVPRQVHVATDVVI